MLVLRCVGAAGGSQTSHRLWCSTDEDDTSGTRPPDQGLSDRRNLFMLGAVGGSKLYLWEQLETIVNTTFLSAPTSGQEEEPRVIGGARSRVPLLRRESID